MRCDRCGRESLFFTGSYFNTELICFECAELEHKRLDANDVALAYEQAKRWLEAKADK